MDFKAEEGPGATGKYRVLIVDDEPEIVTALARVLRRSGFEVEGAHGGAEALEVVGRFPPHVVLSDYRMPDANGLELLREIARRLPGVKKVLLSGFANVGDPEQLARERIVFLRKPWDETGLVPLVTRLLEGDP